MRLRSIEIKNFRSIEDLTFNVEEIFFNQTFALIGINESGKSNFLEAIALVGDTNARLSKKDYTDRSKEVRITLKFELKEFGFEEDDSEIIQRIISEHTPRDYETVMIGTYVDVGVIFSPITKGRDGDRKKFFMRATTEAKQGNRQLDESLKKIIDEELTEYFGQGHFHVTLWKPEKEYVINDSIDLNEFAEEPTKFIPLLNCFKMADLEPKDMFELTEANEHDVAGKLEEVVTKYINKAWPSYPVRIKFHIGGGKLTFLVEDKESGNESETIEQRSDGFRWFVSFLLTIASDHSIYFQERPLLLLDEPDLRLHPQAQADLLRELIKMTQGMNRETVLFFATHSIHMVDKEQVERCYKFSKQDGVTKVERADKGILNSYAEVNYSVFEVASNDYHNELYGYLASTTEGWDKLKGLPIYSKPWNNELTGNKDDVSLSRYIRNSIHHPENKENDPFTDEELRESIETMQRLVQEVQAEEMAKAGENGS